MSGGDDKSLSQWKRAAYGFGDFGFNLYWTTVSFYILYFYTDVVGLSGTTAGLVFLIAMLWDGIIDPAMGYYAQKTRSRWGSYRPYFLFGAVPLAASLILTFYRPDVEGAALVSYVLVAHILFRTAYTAVNIPYGALSANITQSTEVRNSLSAWRISLATVGSAFVAYSTLKLVTVFGQGDAEKGFVLTATLYAALSIPVFLILFATMRESPPALKPAEPTNFRKSLVDLRKNKPFLVIAGATMLATIGGVLASKTLVYYFKYVLGDDTAVGTAFAVNSVVILISAPFWAYVTAKTSKRFVWRMGAVVSITGSLLLFFNPCETVPVVVGIAALSSVGSAAGYLTFWSALPDTVEYGELRTGRRDESLVFGVMGFIQGASYGVGVALAGMLLDLIGYQANATQSESTLQAIKAMMTLIPAGLILLAFIVIGSYRIDRITHQRIRAILRKRAERG
ncbi:MAG: MFS transporter [Sphingorhabdus sp.]|nr:MFS transporter [Sphingorhabdus sp.]